MRCGTVSTSRPAHLPRISALLRRGGWLWRDEVARAPNVDGPAEVAQQKAMEIMSGGEGEGQVPRSIAATGANGGM
jgi:hypothetical protein